MIQSASWLRHGLAGVSLTSASRFAFLPGYSARYFVLGSTSARPLILLPGLAGGMDLVLPLAERLSRHFRVYLLQPRGEDTPYDLSAATTLNDLGQDVLDFQQAIHVERPFLLGCSFGGLVALRAASLAAGRFAGVAVQGVGPTLPSPILRRIASKAVNYLVPPVRDPLVEEFFGTLFGTRWVLPELRRTALQTSWQTDLGVVSRRCLLAEPFQFEKLSSGLSPVPLLIQAATRDVMASPEAWKPWRRVLPRMILQTLDNAGHFAFLTHGQAMTEQLVNFTHNRMAVTADVEAE
jgi:pimeloyl-ACP methyl ester carboxylesterase